MDSLQALEKQAVVIQTIDSLRKKGSWTGETHIQKTLFFLQSLLRVPLGYQFVLYKHGPYSFDLHEDIGRMRAHDFTQFELRPPYGPSFTLGRLANRLLDRYEETLGRYGSAIEFASESLGVADTRELERYGTALFVSLEHPEQSTEALCQKIIELKPHIQSDQALEALNFVGELKNRLPAIDGG